MKRPVADAGFLVALWSRHDRHHDWAVATAKTHPPPWTTCEAVLSEAEHLLGPAGRQSLRTACRRGALQIVPVASQDSDAIMDLLDKYEDVPMSFADACIVRISEMPSIAEVLTTDRDFEIYRRHGRRKIPCLLPP